MKFEVKIMQIYHVQEIFIALCFVSLIVAYPAENVENVEPLVEVVQVEADDTGSDEDTGDLAVDESRYYGEIFYLNKMIFLIHLINYQDIEGIIIITMVVTGIMAGTEDITEAVVIMGVTDEVDTAITVRGLNCKLKNCDD